MDHLENQKSFFDRLEELRGKHNNKVLKQELEEMEKELSQNELAPYSYQGPQNLKKQKNRSHDSKILLFYFYNSINK
jgi:hypothetical protein